MKTYNLQSCTISEFVETTIRAAVYEHADNHASFKTEVRISSMAGFRPFIQGLGGFFTIFESNMLKDIDGSIMRWATHSYSSGGMIVEVRLMDIPEEQFNLIKQSLHGNNHASFHKPTAVTMIDDLYFVLPDNMSDITLRNLL